MSIFKVNPSIVLALCIVLLVGAWMASGMVRQDSAAGVPEDHTVPLKLMTVQAERLEPVPISRVVTVQGELEPLKTATLRAEVSGQVEKVLAQRGDRVRKDQIIVQLRMNDRQARLKQAETLVRQRETEYQAKQDLVGQGLLERIAEKETLSALESARAALETVRLEIEHTSIRAPFDGLLEHRPVEVGDLVAVNDQVALLVDTSTLIAAGQIPQQEIQHVRPGNQGMVRLITGQQARGTVRFVASMPDKSTQTFRVELEIGNVQRDLPSGVSAEIVLPVEEIEAHFLSPASLVLDPGGAVGVKTVDREGRVAFQAVRTVRAQKDGIWVSGLRGTVTVIVAGQGFVSAGEQVDIVYHEAGARAAALEY
jgi:membrane fusion protein, multidrug efflux system